MSVALNYDLALASKQHMHQRSGSQEVAEGRGGAMLVLSRERSCARSRAQGHDRTWCNSHRRQQGSAKVKLDEGMQGRRGAESLPTCTQEGLTRVLLSDDAPPMHGLTMRSVPKTSVLSLALMLSNGSRSKEPLKRRLVAGHAVSTHRSTSCGPFMRLSMRLQVHHSTKPS